MSLARARSARRIKSSNTCGAESSWSRFGWVKSVVITGLACRFDRLSRHASRAQEQTHDGIQGVYSGSHLGSPYDLRGPSLRSLCLLLFDFSSASRMDQQV